MWHAREFVELGHSVTALRGAETREAAEGRFFCAVRGSVAKLTEDGMETRFVREAVPWLC